MGKGTTLLDQPPGKAERIINRIIYAIIGLGGVAILCIAITGRLPFIG